MKAYLGIILMLALALFKQDAEDSLPINKIQVIGSHNSYKKAINPALFKVFQKQDSVGASKIDYEHINITDQLDLGLLNLEIDVYADEKGGKYAHPKGLEWAKGQPPYNEDGIMNQPGFKILHIPELDFRVQYATLKQCLNALRNWSEAHPDHKPIFITFECKDSKPKNPNFTIPEKFTSRTFEQLDSIIKEDLGMKHLLTPDMVRGKYKTLNEAVEHDNWPTLKKAKGKFMFILDDKETKRDIYIAGHPSLRGRVLFANAEAGTPEAAAMIINDPKNPDIPGLVKRGYIIRTRADADTEQARTNDKSDFIAACNSGAQIITTDYYKKSTHFKSDYVISFEGASKYFRLNPLFNRLSASANGK